MSLTAKKTGTLQGSAAFLLGLLNLPGSSGSYMALGTSHPTNFDTTSTNFFIECWVYLNALPAATKVYYIVLRGTGVYAAEDIGLRILPSGVAEFYSYGAGNTIAIPNSGTVLSLNTWYHLAGSIDSLSKTVYIFLNGVLKNSASMAGAPRTTAGSNFFIGTPTIQTDWAAANCYIQDMRVVRGGNVPKLSFTPEPSTFNYFSLLAPSYVQGGTCVLSLMTQYFPNTPTIITPSGRAGGYGPNGTGGDLTQIIDGNKVHFFTTVGTQTLTVTGSGYVTILVVAGGGGGGYDRASGGGAGGVIYTTFILQPGTYSVIIGDGGAGSTTYAVPASGSNSSFGSLIAVGGGGGACGGSTNAVSGGSGGGAQAQNGTTLPGNGTSDQGNSGGFGAVSGTSFNSGGGGGAGGKGVSATSTNGGNGGPGRAFTISGTLTYYGGGGGGSRAFDGGVATTSGLGGIGGGGNAGQTAGANGSAGTPNTGGGGGGGANIPQGRGGKGGSGIIIVSYPISIPSQIKNNYLFSQISTSTMAAAYSLRSLTGGVVRAVNVRRSSDNATQDFLVDTAGNMFISLISRQSLESWLGNSTGYVTTWYDQSGQGRNATTNGTSPIVTGYLINSFYGLNFQSSAGLLTSAFTNSTTVTVVMVVVIKSTIATWGMFAHHGNRDLDWALEQNGTQPSFIHFQSNNDNSGDQLSIVYDTPMILYGTMTSGTAMTFQMITSAATYNTSTTVTLSSTVGSKVLYIGKSDVGESCNSYIGEFNYFSSILSASDSANLIANIRSRWNI